LIALAALFLISVRNAFGSSEGYRLAEALCKPCHAIEPHLAGLSNQAPSFDAIANRHGTTVLSLKVFLKTNHARTRRAWAGTSQQRENVQRAREPQMYANILLSTDGSDIARKGVKDGIALAKALNAKVTVITVTEAFAAEYISTKEEIDRFDGASKERAGKVLDEARAIAERLGISAEFLHVQNWHPATAIIETAKSRGCDLIVMASHGHRGIRKLLLGSQTSEVLLDGSVPVLVVH
jgi:nucleotide-binding universal stress UspA family protein